MGRLADARCDTGPEGRPQSPIVVRRCGGEMQMPLALAKGLPGWSVEDPSPLLFDESEEEGGVGWVENRVFEKKD